MKRCALYVRVSTQEQKRHGLSVDSQIVALRQYCDNNGYEIVKIYNDAGISARKRYTKRPALLELCADCDAGKIDLILFTKLDRYFRAVADYYEVQKILDRNDVKWRAIWEDYETETSAGVFKVNIMLSVAQSEADRTSERIKAVNQYKRERGDYVGKAPLGYKMNHGSLEIDREAYDGVKAWLDTYISTGSMRKAMIAGSELGFKYDRATLMKAIKNPVYCGEASGGYKCEPYITKEEHESILRRLSQYSRQPKADGREYIFSGILFCGFCDARMSGHAVKRTHADGENVIYKKYVCQRHDSTKLDHPHIQVVEHVLEDYLLDILEELYSDHIESIKALNESAGSASSMKRKKALEAKLQRLAVLFEDGDMDVETYRQKRDSIKEQISEIHFDLIPEPEPLPDDWKKVYSELDDAHRQIFWKSIIKRIVVTKGENPVKTKNPPSFSVEFL